MLSEEVQFIDKVEVIIYVHTRDGKKIGIDPKLVAALGPMYDALERVMADEKDLGYTTTETYSQIRYIMNFVKGQGGDRLELPSARNPC